MSIRKISSGFTISTKSVNPVTVDASSGAPAASNPIVEYLVVSGGGGTASSISGGGSGGSVISGFASVNTGISYSVTVGAGGTGTTSGPGGRGGSSKFANYVIGLGGSSGSLFSDGTLSFLYVGSSGGGRGGAGGTDTAFISAFGNRGGNCSFGTYVAGGGGSTFQTGRNATTDIAGKGANGVASSITGTQLFYGGGGGGSAHQGATRVGGAAGSGGGGAGGVTSGATGGSGAGAGTSGTTNTGGGGGGSGYDSTPVGGSGGSGVVILSYSTSFANATSTGSPVYSQSGGKRIFKFTGTGSITF
jgi:hypothetical protein